MKTVYLAILVIGYCFCRAQARSNYDSISRIVNARISHNDSILRRNKVLMEFKKSGAKPLFNSQGLMLGCIKKNGEKDLFNEYGIDSISWQRRFRVLNRQDWEDYLAGKIKLD